MQHNLNLKTKQISVKLKQTRNLHHDRSWLEYLALISSFANPKPNNYKHPFIITINSAAKVTKLFKKEKKSIHLFQALNSIKQLCSRLI